MHVPRTERLDLRAELRGIAMPGAPGRVPSRTLVPARLEPELGQRFFDPFGDGLHLQGRARDLSQHLLGPHPLALAPELAEKRPGLPRGEPARPELLLQVGAELRLERPG